MATPASSAKRPVEQPGAPLAATELVEAAKRSIGAHHVEPYVRQARSACEDLDGRRRRSRELEGGLYRGAGS